MSAVMLDLTGLELMPEERELIKHPQVAGIILFSRNYETPEQLEQLIQQIRTTRKELLIAVDQEGGRVQRFREGFTELPALATIGELYPSQTALALQLAEIHAWVMAMELRAVDIDFSFAPVLDLQKNISQVIGNRAFSADTVVVSDCGKAYISGMQRAGMAAIGKHFPGHGSVSADSHTEIPVDTRSFSAIKNQDLIPFQTLCKQGLAGIMPAHIIYSEIDKLPAGFSHYWLQTVLRGELGFNGAIISDDLMMEGASIIGDVAERAKVALAAGCDMVLICNKRDAAVVAVETLEKMNFANSAPALQRLRRLIGKGTITRTELRNSSAWHQAVKLLQQR